MCWNPQLYHAWEPRTVARATLVWFLHAKFWTVDNATCPLHGSMYRAASYFPCDPGSLRRTPMATQKSRTTTEALKKRASAEYKRAHAQVLARLNDPIAAHYDRVDAAQLDAEAQAVLA